MDLTAIIETRLGSKVISTAPLGVGFGLVGLHCVVADGREVAVKARSGAAQNASADQLKGGEEPDLNGVKLTGLEIEGYMLRELGARSDLPIPEVYHGSPDLLIMSWLANDHGAITPHVERHAAELLAELHSLKFNDPAFSGFGYSRDTLIGPLHQPNPRTPSWIDFFRDHRLLYMARAAHDEGQLSAGTLARIETFTDRLGEYLIEPAHPSLIHGDLWTGNILVNAPTSGGRIGAGKIAGFVDPAIYVAHPEIELAFTTMFNTFGSAFFDAYEALCPLEPGFHDVRCEIYNLYPTLVHVRLFGSSYLSGIDRVLKRHGI